MSTLRKACARCTASKRKCIVQKPKCARCLQKNLDCVYDLEPLEAPVARLDKLLTFGINPSRWGPFGICIINNVRARSSDLDPAVCLPGQSRVLEIVRLGFVTVPDLVRAKKPAVFVHPKLQLAGVDNHFTALVDDKAPGVFCESFKRLFEVEVQAASLGEALTALQAALVHIAGSIFSPCAAEQAEAQKWFEMIPDWTKALLACVDAGLPKRQSPWQDWLLGESVRRTVFMAYVLNMAVFGYNHGYCSNWLYMEALPFDARPGLWMAGSPQAWIAAAHAKLGEEVGERLNSYHEFAEAGRGQEPDLCGDLFLALVISAHNGLGGN